MNSETTATINLIQLKEELDKRENKYLSPFATPSRDGKRRQDEKKSGHRQAFALDGDRILHSRSYTRYIDKTQVFYLVNNDHITHRVLHVQLVSKIARTIGRFLGLNEDLIEAIALGHDIGHPPFGHDGEKELASICKSYGLPAFQHNIQSVRFLDKIEKGGGGWNLTLQTLDGILCHDGEIHNQTLSPSRGKTFVDFDRELHLKAEDSNYALFPMTLEGCVVRFADTIAYIGRDIEDAIELKLILRSDIPKACREILGSTNGSIVYRLVEDLITNSRDTILGIGDKDVKESMADGIGFSREISESLRLLKEFNYERIYLNSKIKNGFDKIRVCYRSIFKTYMDHLKKNVKSSKIFSDFINELDTTYLERNTPASMVRDFIAGMTDDYFLEQASHWGFDIPKKIL